MKMAYTKDDLVKVTIMLFPDGKNWYFLSNVDFMNQLHKTWKKSIPEEKLEFYEDNEVFVQVLEIDMLREDFFAIQGGIVVSEDET